MKIEDFYAEYFLIRTNAGGHAMILLLKRNIMLGHAPWYGGDPLIIRPNSIQPSPTIRNNNMCDVSDHTLLHAAYSKHKEEIVSLCLNHLGLYYSVPAIGAANKEIKQIPYSRIGILFEGRNAK
jgi:hypothetical protein